MKTKITIMVMLGVVAILFATLLPRGGTTPQVEGEYKTLGQVFKACQEDSVLFGGRCEVEFDADGIARVYRRR